MRKLFLALLLAFSPFAQAPGSDCKTLDACLFDSRELASTRTGPPGSMSQQEGQVGKRLLKFDGAVPALVALLADTDLVVANVAASVLSDAEAVDPKFLPQVLAGLDRGLTSLPAVLGAMNSDAACQEAVARYLVSQRGPDYSEGYAVQRCAARAIPFILKAAQCGSSCGKDDHYLLSRVLEQMGRERAQAGPVLLRLATAEDTPTEVASGAVRMIGSLGSDGRVLEAELLVLRERKVELYRVIDHALIAIGAQRSGAIFAARLSEHPDIVTLRDLAETGHPARDAGGTVVELLKHPDWDIRIGAGRALGFIGYAPASQALIPLLSDVGDVRLNWVAAESLGRLRATDALEALRMTAASHWYPAVRLAAADAVQHIQDGSSYVSKFGTRNFPFEFFAYEQIGRDLAPCPPNEVVLAAVDETQKLYPRFATKRLAALAYDTYVVSAGATSESAEKSKLERPQVVEIKPENMDIHPTRIRQIPDVALRVEGGWLAGSRRGEWGGELVYIADKGTSTMLHQRNVGNIDRIGNRLIAVVGLAHMYSSRGMLLEVSRSADQSWSAKPWRALPGAPEASGLLRSGELQVDIVGGGSILISADGAMRVAPCSTARPPSEPEE